MPRRNTSSEEHKKLADYAMVFDLVGPLASLQSEDAVIEKIFDIFSLLCAPKQMFFLPVIDGHPGEARGRQSTGAGKEELSFLATTQEAFGSVDEGTGFFVQIHANGKPVGVFVMKKFALPEHHQHYLNLAVSMSGVMALAFSNAHTFESLNEARRRSDVLNDINKVISSSLNFEQIMRQVVASSREATGCDSSAVIVKEDGVWIPKYAYGLPDRTKEKRFEDTEVRHLVFVERTKEVMAVDDTGLDTRIDREFMDKMGLRSFLAVPLVVRDKVIGVLAYHYRIKAQQFTEDQIEFAKKIGAMVSLALENAHLYAHQRNIADTLQQTLMALPEGIEGVEFNAFYRTATEEVEVGGDFLDLFELGHDRVGIIIGDVSGKGLEAATLTSLAKDALKAYSYIYDSPATIISRTNKVISDQTAAEKLFITVFLAILNLNDGLLTYCSAGHPPPILIKSGVKQTAIQTGSPPIGIYEQINFEQRIEQLAPGDVIVFYTDGVTEARRDHELYGEKRLATQAQKASQGPMNQLARRIFQDVSGFCRGSLSDDAAILAVSFKGRQRMKKAA